MTSVVKKKQEIGATNCSIFFFIKSDAWSIGLYDARTKFFFKQIFKSFWKHRYWYTYRQCSVIIINLVKQPMKTKSNSIRVEKCNGWLYIKNVYIIGFIHKIESFNFVWYLEIQLLLQIHSYLRDSSIFVFFLLCTYKCDYVYTWIHHHYLDKDPIKIF